MLDECDEMLNMGFVDDVEKILGAGGDIQVGAFCLAQLALRGFPLPKRSCQACTTGRASLGCLKTCLLRGPQE